MRTQLTLVLRVVRAILASPALRHVEIAFLLFNAVEYGTWVAMLLYAYGATGPSSVGLVALIQLAPAAVVAPLSANLADRYRRDRVLLGGYLVQAMAFGLTAVAMAVGAPPVIVYVGAAAAATSLTTTRPTQGALLPSVSRTPEELTAANGLSGTVEGAGLMLGPLAAAGILALATPTAVYGAGAVACLIAATLVARLPVAARTPAGVNHPITEAQDASAQHDGLLSGIRVVRRAGATRLVVGILALRLLTVGATDVLFVLLALEVFHVGGSGASLLSAALGLGMVAGGAVTFSLVGRQRLAPVLAVAAVLWGACLALVGTVAPVWLAAPLIALGGIGYAACDVVGRTILQRVTADRMLARVLGALEGIGLIGLATGSLLAPVIVAVVGIEPALVVVGVLLPLGVLLGWSGLRAIDRTGLVPTRGLDLLRAGALFAPLAPPQLEIIARRSRWLTFEPGEAVIREGDPGDAYYVLESGELSISQGGRHLRNITDRGEGLGEIALLRDIARTATVTAVRPSVLLMLGRADFLEAMTGHPQVHDAARRVAAERLPVEEPG